MAKLSVLVVEDDKELRETLAKLLKLFNFEVATADGVSTAWTYLQSPAGGQVSLVVTDVRMPGEDGMVLVQRIKQKDARRPIVFVMTGFTDYSLEDVYDMGADGLFQKPFDATDIREAARRAQLSRRELWGQPVSGQPAACLKGAVEKKNMGRGGFLLDQVPEDLSVRDLVSFDLTVKDPGGAFQMSGIGRVRYHFLDRVGAAIEILFLDDNCRESVVKWYEAQNIVPYIPKG